MMVGNRESEKQKKRITKHVQNFDNLLLLRLRVQPLS
jgi:hypothetical protein